MIEWVSQSVSDLPGLREACASKNVWTRKLFWPKKYSNQKNLCTKKMLTKKKNLHQKNFTPNFFWPQKSFWSKKFFDPKFFRLQNRFQPTCLTIFFFFRVSPMTRTFLSLKLWCLQKYYEIKNLWPYFFMKKASYYLKILLTLKLFWPANLLTSKTNFYLNILYDSEKSYGKQMFKLKMRLKGAMSTSRSDSILRPLYVSSPIFYFGTIEAIGVFLGKP